MDVVAKIFFSICLKDHVEKECTFAKVRCPEKCGMILPQVQIKNLVKNMWIVTHRVLPKWGDSLSPMSLE